MKIFETGYEKASISPIDQVNAHEKTSGKYNFVNTKNIIDYMSAKGFEVSKTSQARSLKYQGYQKHIVRFRPVNMQLQVNDYLPEIVLINDHHAASSVKVLLGIYRLVCANGLIVGNSFYNESIRHTGFTYNKLDAALNKAIDTMPLLINKIEAMKSKQCTYEQACEMALIAMKSRGIDTDAMLDYRPAFTQLFRVHRAEDQKQDVFTVFNVIQENITKLPIRYRLADTGENKTARRISSLEVNVKVNQSLFDTALQIAA